MNFSLIDVGGCLVAVVAGLVVLVLPGLALAHWLGIAIGRSDESARPAEPLAAIVVGLALLPGLDSVATRLIGLNAGMIMTLGLAFAGLVIVLRRGIVRPSRLAGILVVCWFVLLVAEWADYDIAGGLYQTITVFDAVKHAATIQAIADGGAPLRDSFFLRPVHAGYYYFFYTPAALILRLSFGLIDARAAFAGTTFWAGLGAYGIVRLALARLGTTDPRPMLILAVMGAGGLDCLAIILVHASMHVWPVDPLHWNEQVGAWLEDLFWVPHHVTGLIAGTIGCIALCDAVDARSEGLPWRPIATAGIALASCFGLSIWVAFAFAVTLGAWTLWLVISRRWRALVPVALAGLLALVLVLPQVLDLKAGRAGDLPIAATMRIFTPVDWIVPEGRAAVILRSLALPLNYAIEFGVLTFGAIVAFRAARRPSGVETTFGLLLFFMAASGLILGAVLRSTQLGNDLGWRVTLLPLLAGTVWTVPALERMIAEPRPLLSPTVFVVLGLGWATTLYGLVAARAYPLMPATSPIARFIAADPATARGLRVAYEWAAHDLPASAVLQQNPSGLRALAFGLYGRQRTGVSDLYGSLFGADPKAVTARIAALGPIFSDDLDVDAVRAIATRAAIDDFVVTANDPVWSRPDSFVWRAKPVYASSRVRIVPVAALGAGR